MNPERYRVDDIQVQYGILWSVTEIKKMFRTLQQSLRIIF
ncbi:protein of unknown function [Methanocaldococcus lauensis]|nr:protein of unknown function [Methanocaldococcus lauensis]